MGEQTDGVAITLAGAVHIFIVVALVLWGLSVARKHGNRRFWKWMAWTPVLASVLETCSIPIAIALLIRAFNDVAYTPAAERAEQLSEGIRVAMLASALFYIPALALYLAAIVTFLVGTFRSPVSASAAASTSQTDPPP